MNTYFFHKKCQYTTPQFIRFMMLIEFVECYCFYIQQIWPRLSTRNKKILNKTMKGKFRINQLYKNKVPMFRIRGFLSYKDIIKITHKVTTFQAFINIYPVKCVIFLNINSDILVLNFYVLTTVKGLFQKKIVPPVKVINFFEVDLL